MSLESDANTIAAIIRKTDSDNRGDLIYMVAQVLQTHGQNYTASLLGGAAKIYGLSKCKRTK
jgi:hypothetical protein